MTRIETGDGWEMRLGRWQNSPIESCDHVITDPPFTDHVSQNQRRGNAESKRGGGFDEFSLSFDGVTPREVKRACAAAIRWSIAWCAVEQIGEFATFDANAQPIQPIYLRCAIWVKTNPTPQFSGDRPAMWGEACAIMHCHPCSSRFRHARRWNGKGKAGRYRGPYERVDRVHETQKPLWLMRELLEDFTDPGELVWDPYAGSGTTGVACLQLGRRFIGHEMQEHYFEAACDRLRAAERGQGLAEYRAGQEVLL